MVLEMGKKSWTGDAVLIILVLLIAGRVINLPVALFLVSGQSMYPVLKTGDLVVGEAVYLTSYHVGDIVVWYRTFSYGVIHKVVEIRNGIVVTKGVNNPAPDPPVPSFYVKYKIILHIPRHIWLPGLVLLAGLYAYYRRRDILEALKSPEPEALTIAGWILAFFILLDMAVIFLSTLYYDSYRVALQPPSVSLRSVALLPDKPVARIVYNVNGTHITGVEDCNISVGEAFYNCSTFSFTNNSVYAGIPVLAITQALRRPGLIAMVTLHLKIAFTSGNLTGKYNIIIPWKPLSVETIKDGVRIVNPNYIPVNISMQVNFYVYQNGVIDFLDKRGPQTITVPPHAVKTINIPKEGSFARVVITYTYKPGSTKIIQEVVRVDYQ